MKLTTSMIAAISILSLPGIALANDDDGRFGKGGSHPAGVPQQQRYWDPNPNNVEAEVHIHSGGCNHGQPPPPPSNVRGRYELRTVSQWVPGRWEQVWVPERCFQKRWKRVCKGGHYDSRYIEGRHEHVQQWVWVPYYRRDYPRHHASPAGFEVRLGARL